MKKTALMLSLVLMVSLGHAQKDKEEYVHPMFEQMAVNHKAMAVLPFKFVTTLREEELKNITAEQLKTMERIDGQLFQNSVYEFLKKKEQGPGLSVELQNVNVTNEILKNNNISPGDVGANTVKNIAKALGVDVVIFGNMNTSEPFSNGAAVALDATVSILTVGFAGITAHSAEGVMQITDAKSGALLWRYRINLGKGSQSSTDAIVEKIMKKSSRNIPYIK